MEKRKLKYLAFRRLIGKVRTCNLCSEVFTLHNSYERICPDCKADNEEYRYSEWLHEGAVSSADPAEPRPNLIAS